VRSSSTTERFSRVLEKPEKSLSTSLLAFSLMRRPRRVKKPACPAAAAMRRLAARRRPEGACREADAEDGERKGRTWGGAAILAVRIRAASDGWIELGRARPGVQTAYCWFV
jgi:hypothetical protein